MRKIILFGLLPGSLAFLPIQPLPGSPAPETPPLEHAQFAFQLLNTILAGDTTGSNMLISPLDVYLTMAMLYNGAAPDNRDSIAAVLQLSERAPIGLNVRCRQIQQGLPLEDNRVSIVIANSIWYNRRRIKLPAGFENAADQYYYTPAEAMNFSHRGVAALIDQWADRTSQHRIPAVIDHIDPRDSIYVIATTWLRSEWTMPFPPAGTAQGLFQSPGGTPKTVSYMRRTGVIRTYSDTSFTMLELPFGKGEHYGLFVLLPEADDRPLPAWAAELSADRLTDAISKMTDQTIDLSLPRWEYSYSIGDLRETLRPGGMDAAFAWVNRAVHKTCIRVNEKGVEETGDGPDTAAASGPIPRHSRPIRADRPFLYFVMEKQQQLMLLMGVVNDPSALSAVPVKQPALVPPRAPVRHRRR